MSQFAFAQFCDDIRREVGNKLSLMGVYGGDLFVAETPAFIPKLAVAITFLAPELESVETLRFRVMLDGQALIDAEAPVAILRQQFNAQSGRDSDEAPLSRASVTFHGFVPPITVAKRTLLRAVVVANGHDLEAGKLRLGKAPLHLAG